ncbi:hypothetical protein [Pararhizobium antarcticum]|uniref:Uncharacterized protein n=1 Tax=Pararhizobium antarcticum TaxID=1798805 RepID=A0A657LXR2_9HYPH|nr:hypothetical protein [Pararhizobium antarcticum]OJG00217.1 hypothetical protein AX760_10860 [Pararhizobium antarcticum]OJG00849.1 hypothetical protein AX761_07970 [Rhizobium sp. 58]
MRRLAAAVLGLSLVSCPAVAQETNDETGVRDTASATSGGSMSSLLAKGYEIKAAVPNGARYIVFLQKDKSAFACEFVTLTKSRCGSIN